MFHIKICGVREIDDIHAVADSGADAIGLNFFPASVRFVDPTVLKTAELSQVAAQRGLYRVGVFVNESIESIAATAKAIGLEMIQLHGDEPVSFARELSRCGRWPLIRAIKLPKGGLEPAAIEVLARPWIDIGCHPLLDADGGAAHGGSGQTLDWDAVRRWQGQSKQGPNGPNGEGPKGDRPVSLLDQRDQMGTGQVPAPKGDRRISLPAPQDQMGTDQMGTDQMGTGQLLGPKGGPKGDRPFTLAGGLNPANVAEAIRHSGAISVDTASGVESTKGHKDRELIQAFARACRAVM